MQYVMLRTMLTNSKSLGWTRLVGLPDVVNSPSEKRKFEKILYVHIISYSYHVLNINSFSFLGPAD